MRNKTEQRASSSNRSFRRKNSEKYFSKERKEFKTQYIRQLNTEQYLDLLPWKKPQSKVKRLADNIDTNLPEFLNFQSDHLLLSGLIASHPFYDRSRGSSTFSTSKFNRQTTNHSTINPLSSPTTAATVLSAASPRSNHSASKRSSRSRHTHSTTISHSTLTQHHQQQTHITRPLSLRQMTNKFDSMSCFHEPDLSSDGDQQQLHYQQHHAHNNNYNAALSSSSSSSALDHPYPKDNVFPSTILATARAATSILDEDAHEIDAIIKQHKQILTNDNTNTQNNTSITAIVKTPTTPTITSKWTSSRQSSRMASPALSTSSQSSGRIITFLNHEVIQLPTYLEREIRVKCNFDQLGLVVDAYVDEGVNGCHIRSVASISTIVNRDSLKPGDYVLSINNESMKKISNAQARSIIRRASLIGSDISVIFIPADEAKHFKDLALNPQTLPSPIPPEIIDTDFEQGTNKSNVITIQQDTISDGFDSHTDQQIYSTVIDSETLSATLWGPPRTVTLHRDEHLKGLGISIVGGKLDFSGPGNTIESCISGIFIKHVISDSPAGRNGTLKTGDRILEVNGHDLRDASHDRAVQIIRAAQSPVHFIVQSLHDPSNPVSTSNDQSSLNNVPHIPNISPTQTKILNTSKYSLGYERKTEEELIKQYGHLCGDLLFIDIRRNSSEITEPLGLSLIGHRDPNKLAVFVCDIQPGSLLDRDHRIRPGDQLLEVNGEILLGKAHSAVTPIIKSIKADTLNFVVLRNPNSINDMALNNQHAAAARLRASAMASSSVEFSSTSPKLLQSQQLPPLLKDSIEQQMINDAIHHHHNHAHVSRLSLDINENNDELMSIKLISTIESMPDKSEHISISNEVTSSVRQTVRPTMTATATKDDKLATSEAISSALLPSNQIMRTNDAQCCNDNNNENDVFSFNHNIDRNATITAFHSISSDGNSPTRRFMPSSFDQQAHAYENDESLHPFSQPSPPVPSSLLMHEQPNHANDKYIEPKNLIDNYSSNTRHNPDSSISESSFSTTSHTVEKRQDDNSTTQMATTQLLNEISSLDKQILPLVGMPSTPTKQKIENRLSEGAIVTTKSNTNNDATASSRLPLTSSSSSSSSSLSVSTPSSNEHVSKKALSSTLSQVHRRASMSTPGPPITLVLNKDQKGSFGLTVIQRGRGIWIQSVQPHGTADQQDIRAGDQLIQINGTPVEALGLMDVQNMLEHSNSNQIHLTCVPYREPQPQPVVVNINQEESLSILVPNDSDPIREDDPRVRPIIVGQETYIEIDRGQSGLGLSVVGGFDTQLSAIIIHDIYDGCAAQRDGRLHVGDQILEVNSIDLRLATHEEAIQALRQSTNVVGILVLRAKILTDVTNEQDKFDIISIELIKKSGKGLGFSIIGRRHGHGVFVSHILEGGCAEKDGRLMSGDLILEVNGQDLRAATYEHVAYTLKTLPHGRVSIKIGRLKPSARSQTRQNSLPHDRKSRSRSSSSNIRRSSANKINDR